MDYYPVYEQNDSGLFLSYDNEIKNELVDDTNINENNEKFYNSSKEKKEIKEIKSNYTTGPNTKCINDKIEKKPKNCLDKIDEKLENEGNEIENNEISGPTQNKLGRKKKNSDQKGKHTKYSEDNVIRKIKAIIISSLKDFINSVISNAYNNNIGKGVFRKELLKMNQSQIVNSKYNREFLNKSLKEIFSEDISAKYNNYQPDRNRIIIEGLLNETDFNKKTLFTNLFDLTFLECVKHIRGENQNNLLNGLASLENLLDNLCEKCENDEEYLELFQYYTNNLETIIGNKRRRKTKSV